MVAGGFLAAARIKHIAKKNMVLHQKPPCDLHLKPETENVFIQNYSCTLVALVVALRHLCFSGLRQPLANQMGNTHFSHGTKGYQVVTDWRLGLCEWSLTFWFIDGWISFLLFWFKVGSETVQRINVTSIYAHRKLGNFIEISWWNKVLYFKPQNELLCSYWC